MATSRETIFTCDAPECSASVRQIWRSEPPKGLQGKVRHTDSTGGTGLLPWYSCSFEHIGPALSAVVHEAYGD